MCHKTDVVHSLNNNLKVFTYVFAFANSTKVKEFRNPLFIRLKEKFLYYIVANQ